MSDDDEQNLLKNRVKQYTNNICKFRNKLGIIDKENIFNYIVQKAKA